MFLYGVVNASPDSLNTDSIATTAEAAVARARQLLAEQIKMSAKTPAELESTLGSLEDWAEQLRELVPER